MNTNDRRDVPAKHVFVRSIAKIVLIFVAVKVVQVAFVYYSGLWHAFLRFIGW